MGRDCHGWGEGGGGGNGVEGAGKWKGPRLDQVPKAQSASFAS